MLESEEGWEEHSDVERMAEKMVERMAATVVVKLAVGWTDRAEVIGTETETETWREGGGGGVHVQAAPREALAHSDRFYKLYLEIKQNQTEEHSFWIDI